MKNFVKYAIDNGGSIHPLVIPAHEHQGLGLMNPSVYNHNGKIMVILRSVNYTFYHSERKLFQHPWGPLTYIHPENDIKLRTWNFYLELDNNLSVSRYNKIDTSRFDTYEPLWEFVGLEDARLVNWEGDFYISGVRRDTTTNGEGRMELSKIEITEDSVVEVDRFRIPTPGYQPSYCEKNWMPLLDTPWHYVKWSNPGELVKVDVKNNQTHFVNQSNIKMPINRDPRGGSQVLSYGDGYFALTHEVDLFKSDVGRKDAVYKHRFVVWDKNFDIAQSSEAFSIMDGDVEFAVGMCEYNENDILITFGFQDNAAYLLRVSKKCIVDFINGEYGTV